MSPVFLPRPRDRMLGLIKRTSKRLNDLKALRTLYCPVVWSPYSLKNIDKLEGI